MSFITTIRGGAALTPASLEYLRARRSWPLDPIGPANHWPEDAPRLSGDEETSAGPIRHFAESRLVADCVAAALADAGLSREDIAGPDTGFVSGSCYGCIEFLDGIREGLARQGPRGVRATEFSIATHGYPMAALAMAYGAQGPATAFVGGSGAAVEALAFAQLMLRIGFCRRMVVVGYELPGKVVRSHMATAASCVVALVVEAVTVAERPSSALTITAAVEPTADTAPGSDRPVPPGTLGAAPLLDVFDQLRGQSLPIALHIELLESSGNRTRLHIAPSSGPTPGRTRLTKPSSPVSGLELIR